MVILGLDASSAVTGWSIIKSNENNEINLIDFGEILLDKFKKKSYPLQYIKVLYDEIEKIIKKYNPELCIVEDIYVFNKLTYKSLSRIRGICEIACLNNDVQKIFAIAPTSARKTVLGEGKGGTKSPAICTILEKRFGKSLATKGFDQSDSILIGIYGAMTYANTKINGPNK
jgi:crossover junction endodeoxyribonuclease RuvC